MLLANLQVSIVDVTGDTITLKTELGQTITISHDLMPQASVGMKIFLAADLKPLISSERHAKDVLNEILK